MTKILLQIGLPALLLLSGCTSAPVADMASVETALEEHRYFDARDGLLALRQEEGRTPSNARLLAGVFVRLGDGYSAERYLNEWQPSDEDAAEWTSLRAHALVLQERRWDARNLLNEFEGMPPQDGEHAWLLAWSWMEEGDPDEARKALVAGLEQYPQSASLNAGAARLAVWDGDWTSADEHIAIALEQDPRHYEALLLQGESNIAQTDLESALQSYTQAMEAYPDFAVPQANVIGLLMDLDRLEEANEQLSRSLGDFPEFGMLRFLEARLAAKEERWSEARTMLQALPADYKRNNPAAIVLEGEAEAALGNHAIARTLYQSVANDPRVEHIVPMLMAQLPSS